jgi:8-oxo-dGTP pyrophosphatase MutT (NUDIX family)
MADAMYPTDLSERLVAVLDPQPDHRPAPGDRLAAVLVPLIEGRSVVFTKRSEALRRHPGEISFPGGLRHEEDPTIADTALRETHEELGIEPGAVEVLGALPPVHTFVSGILVVPFVGLLSDRPLYRPNAGEIAEVLEYGMDELAAAETDVEWLRGAARYRGFAYPMGPNTIWGATARILHSLLELVPGGSRA